MSLVRVAIVRTGLANLASVLAGLRRAGADPYVTDTPADVERESHVMLPGVGAFGPAMAVLNERGITAPLRQRMLDNRPTLCICLGLQLLGATSEESPDCPRGLALHEGAIRRLPSTVRVPHFGWNDLAPAAECKLLQKGYAYFANSYYLGAAPAGWSAAMTTHGTPFVGAMERGKVLACQFHPELSGAYGLDLMKRWLALNDAEDCGC